jgi:hypothetical protein
MVVRNNYDGSFLPFRKISQDFANLPSRISIECRSRLVGEQNFRIG